MRTPLLLCLACILTSVASSPAQNRPARPAPLISPEIGGQGVIFRLRAPQAKEVSLRGQWSKQPVPMTRGEADVWSVTVDPVPPGVWEYSFNVDGLNVLDSSNPAFKPQREPSRSIVHIPSSPPAPWDWQDVPHGTVHRHEYLSKSLGRPRELWVYTPPGYERDPKRVYPLLVLQHGSGDNQRTWIEHGKAHWILDNLIAQGKARLMVVVMLDGHPLGMTARGDEKKRAEAMAAMQRDLLEDALPLVESMYRVEKDAPHRAIAGLSMGGAQSLAIGLGNPDRFAWIGSFSGGPPGEAVLQKVLANPESMNAKLRLLWIAVGRDDFLLKPNQELVAALEKAGVRHRWELTDGDHSWPVWRRYLAGFAPLLFAEAK